MLIAVNSDDIIIPNIQMSTKKLRQFNPDQPRGIETPHIFSLSFLFADNKVLFACHTVTKIDFQVYGQISFLPPLSMDKNQMKLVMLILHIQAFQE